MPQLEAPPPPPPQSQSQASQFDAPPQKAPQPDAPTPEQTPQSDAPTPPQQPPQQPQQPAQPDAASSPQKAPPVAKEPTPHVIDAERLEMSRTTASLKQSLARALAIMFERNMLYVGEKIHVSSVHEMLNNSIDRVMLGRTSVKVVLDVSTQCEATAAEETTTSAASTTALAASTATTTTTATFSRSRSRSSSRRRDRRSRSPSRGRDRDRDRHRHRHQSPPMRHSRATMQRSSRRPYDGRKRFSPFRRSYAKNHF